MFNLLRFLKSKRNLNQFTQMLGALGDRDLTPTDIVSFKEPLRSVLNGAIRTGKVQLADFAKELELLPAEAAKLAGLLVKRGLFLYRDGTTYDVHVSGKTYGHENSRTMELWAKLDKKDIKPKDDHGS